MLNNKTKENLDLIKNVEKRNYISPDITLFIIEMEHSIAVGSASTTVTGSSSSSDDISLEWEKGADLNRSFDW